MPLLFALPEVVTSEVVTSKVVTSEPSIRQEKVEEFLALVNAGLEISRNFSGNQGFDIYVEKDKPEKVLFIEQWESQEHFQRYYLWRLEQGDFEILESYLNSPPVMRKFRRASGGSPA